jgi:pimeloyl-ACP methyl ester carboxylesterase
MRRTLFIGISLASILIVSVANSQISFSSKVDSTNGNKPVRLAPAVAQENFFDSRGMRIHYIDQGTGEPIVLVHGQGGSIEDWVSAGILQNLARDHRVIALDCRGHGMSGKPHEPKQYGREMALDIVRLLDHLGIPQAHIIGYSMGAQLTGLLLTLQPDRILTATLGGGTGRFEWTSRDDQIAEQEALEYEKYGISPTLMHEVSPPNTPLLTDDEIKKRSEAALANPDLDRFASAALTRFRHDQAITPAQVVAVRVPSLGIVGSMDPALSLFRDLNKLRPAMKLIVIDGATHASTITRPEFLAAVRKFIDSNRLSPKR